ncbi:Trk system potassium transporter TrkA [Candidatus Paracaedibacter symbiosus]|uniref:Trk system potassium transporter TrkA n=1 Tax=Candidatus Paracaedibacter symbiosus TaxID=244582 RepID=UPI0005099955|nr:Trk system potassium transporter TrkA [Candidatus Paracaedibacter symbiosus]
MKVVIAGAGRVGFNLAKYLAVGANDVTIIDKSEDLLRRISDAIDVQPIVGYASHPEVLERAGAPEADLFVAVTASDEVNIVACEVANSLFNVQKKIARIRNQSYLDPDWVNLFRPAHLAIDYIISPEVEVAKAISRSIRVQGAFDVIPLLGEDLKMVGVRCGQLSQILNTPLRLIPNLFAKLDFIIACIYRGGDLFIPSGDEHLLLNDEVYFIAHRDQIHQIMEAFNFQHHYGRRVLIMGGGSIGLTLAAEIEKTLKNFQTKVIEKNPQRAEYVARQLKTTEVLCGDVLDVELLKEANIQEAETIISVTQDDKVNILASLLAKKEGAIRAMTLLNNMDYSSLVTSMGVDAIISPHSITVSSILQYVRQGELRSVHSLRNGDVEVIEAEAQESSNVIGLSVEDINIKGHILVAGLRRGNQTFILPPKTTVRVGDRLILVVTKETITKIERLFATRLSYL